MRHMTLLEWLAGISITGILSVVLWALWAEATFDYTKCHATDQYRQEHTSAWVQHMPRICTGSPPICTGGSMIHHPAREWTERLYQCPGKKGHFDKWRMEDKE